LRSSKRGWLLALAVFAAHMLRVGAASAQTDTDQDGWNDDVDACASVVYQPSFDWTGCAPTDQNPGNDAQFECRARERVIQTLLSSGVFVTHIAFSIVKGGSVHFADAFSYVGAGQYVHDPAGIHRL
jgi:hypothetical protein